MNEKGNRYALAALKDKRSSLASEIVQIERKLRHCKEAISLVDATLRLLDPSIAPEEIPTKRPTKRIKLFRQGELSRMIRDALRIAGAPVSTAQIVDHLLKVGGHGTEARKAVAGRVRGNLAYLERKGEVEKLGNGLAARWQLV